MTIDRGLLDRIKARGEEVVTQISADLMSNPRFVKAIESAMRGKEKIEEAAGQALRRMNLPAGGELRRALARIEVLEREVAALKAARRTRRPGARKAATPPAKRKSR